MKKALENYEQEQKQRALERAIRKQKRKVAGTIDAENLKTEKDKLRKLQSDMRNHLEDNPQLRRAYRREKPGPGISNKDLKTHEGSLNQKAIDDNIRETREYIKSDAQVKTLEIGQQNKHIPGTNEYKQYHESFIKKGQYGPSRVSLGPDELQELVNEYASKGELRLTNGEKWNHREIIHSNDKIVGTVVNNITGAEAETTIFKIHYGKKGTHIVPDYPSKKKGGGNSD